MNSAILVSALLASGAEASFFGFMKEKYESVASTVGFLPKFTAPLSFRKARLDKKLSPRRILDNLPEDLLSEEDQLKIDNQEVDEFLSDDEEAEQVPEFFHFDEDDNILMNKQSLDILDESDDDSSDFAPTMQLPALRKKTKKSSKKSSKKKSHRARHFEEPAEPLTIKNHEYAGFENFGVGHAISQVRDSDLFADNFLNSGSVAFDDSDEVGLLGEYHRNKLARRSFDAVPREDRVKVEEKFGEQNVRVIT